MYLSETFASPGRHGVEVPQCVPHLAVAPVGLAALVVHVEGNARRVLASKNSSRTLCEEKNIGFYYVYSVFCRMRNWKEEELKAK